ncbi:hypothetical protein TRP8649_00776 [Pelagimonas phthalicica]|uniref:ABM domain-containing protein n=1 Tax=Pelagimonas phthalicica TaxID=1037362 RepID=A0A238J7H1_9RHOB|nr:hypothetical protein [Pelagimonas phthalicica]TDS94780.1 hypothetical protein CLV87_1295 [Pelagimonas phthalicica]SMX26691.1 hypothetical protein TRP8649_00776 [Pelagimonas phthalicica]
MSVLETVRYRLKPDATPEAAIKAWEKSQSFARAQDGFLSRKLAVTGEGDWLDLVEWRDMTCAKAAGAAFNPANFPELMDLVTVLDESSMVMSHYEVKGETG